MVLLVVRSKEVEGKVEKGQFDRAQFRLIDDETNQTIDQARVKDVRMTMPTKEGEGDEEDKQEDPEEEDEDGEVKQPKVQNVIIMGRISLNGDKWIYEQYNYMYKEDKYTDLFETVGKLELESRDFIVNKENAIKEEQKALIESREAAAQAAAAKAASKKNKKGKPDDKKKKDEKTEEEKVENAIVQSQGPDINYLPGFKQATKDIYSTVFGPISFDLKEDRWDTKKAKDLVLKKLKDQLGNKLKD